MASKNIPSRPIPSVVNVKPATQPSQTLYVKNLTDKLQKFDLRLALYTLFSSYGPVLDVVALKTMKMRGQAHIVFRDVHASTQAMRSLQGFDFFGKEMKIDYGKTKSDIIAKLDGTYRMPAGATAGTGAVVPTEVQQSIFNAPPSSVPASGLPAMAAASLKPPEATTGASEAEDGAKSPQGVKRRRDEESDEEDAPMDDDDEEGDAPMEDSSDEE